jgi:hypothetical protein
MNKQPEALRLADALDKGRYLPATTAAELRRLHEVNVELLGLVKLVYGTFSGGRVMTFAESDVEDFENAIDKAEQTE